MSTLHTCPVCHGAGTVSKPPHVPGDRWEFMTASDPGPWPCHGCAGGGIVWEREPELDYNPVPPNRTFHVPTRYVFMGKGEPAPFELPEEDCTPADRST